MTVRRRHFPRKHFERVLQPLSPFSSLVCRMHGMAWRCIPLKIAFPSASLLISIPCHHSPCRRIASRVLRFDCDPRVLLRRRQLTQSRDRAIAVPHVHRVARFHDQSRAVARLFTFCRAVPDVASRRAWEKDVCVGERDTQQQLQMRTGGVEMEDRKGMFKLKEWIV